MIRRTSVVLVALIVLLLAACSNDPIPPGGAAPTPTPTPTPTPSTEPTQLVVGVDELPAGFNPHLLADSSPVTRAVADLVLPSVFRPDAAGNLRLDPTIATSAKVTSTEPFTVSYELNLEASWSTNAPIAAEDFVYLWERMRADPGVTDAAGYRQITDVRSRAGGKAVDVVFAHPYPAWQHLFSNLLPSHLLKDAPGSWIGALVSGLPASGGPFKVNNVDRARGEVVLARNDTYWDEPSVLDQLVLRALSPEAIAAGLTSGDVDVAIPDDGPTLRAALDGMNPAPHVQSAPQPEVLELGMRGDAGPLRDPYAREGLAALVDRDALRAAVAPQALPADAFALAPSQTGYAPTAPPRPDAAAAAALLTRAGWSRPGGTGPWEANGAPVRLLIGAGAERSLDRRVATRIADQLTSAGVTTTLVVPPATDLFGSPTVAPVLPTPTATPAPSAGATPADASAPPTVATATPPATPTGATAPSTTSAAGGVALDLMVLPRPVGGDPGTELASAFGCPVPTSLVPDPSRSPTRFCFPPLEPLLDDLVGPAPRPGTTAAVESALWAQMPALPLFQPVTSVVSTPASDGVTSVTPGPLVTGPLTGAQRWRQTPPPGGR